MKGLFEVRMQDGKKLIECKVKNKFDLTTIPRNELKNVNILKLAHCGLDSLWGI